MSKKIGYGEQSTKSCISVNFTLKSSLERTNGFQKNKTVYLIQLSFIHKKIHTLITALIMITRSDADLQPCLPPHEIHEHHSLRE